MTIPPRTRRYLLRAGIVVGVAWLLSILVAYLTRNGWWFIAWWPVLIGAVGYGRLTGRLWGPRGRHEQEQRDA